MSEMSSADVSRMPIDFFNPTVAALLDRYGDITQEATRRVTDELILRCAAAISERGQKRIFELMDRETQAVLVYLNMRTDEELEAIHKECTGIDRSMDQPGQEKMLIHDFSSKLQRAIKLRKYFLAVLNP